MTRTAKKPPLFRDPADWARSWGWVSRNRALTAAARLRELARVIEETLGDEDDGAAPLWCGELEAVAQYLAPPTVPAERKNARINRRLARE